MAKGPQGQCLVYVLTSNKQIKQLVMSCVELKALHDSFVGLYMQQPYSCSSDFFHTVLTPACHKIASCSRGRRTLAGTTNGKAHMELVSPRHDVSVSSAAASTKMASGSCGLLAVPTHFRLGSHKWPASSCAHMTDHHLINHDLYQISESLND